MRNGGERTKNPLTELGLDASATAEDVRNAYRNLVKKCHPDKFTDPKEREAAQERMIALNLAYEAALKLTAAKKTVDSYNKELQQQEALTLAEKMLQRKSPESALRYLMRTMHRDGAWYAMQGRILMVMDQYESAHQAYREAVKREPNNNEYRRGALDAAVALKRSRTFSGRVKTLLRRLQKR